MLGVAAVAAETARVAQTRHVVERLHTLLMEYYDTYKTRRVKLRPSDPNTTDGIEDQINAKLSGNAAASRGQALAEARLYALREMMLMEVPDRWSDVTLADIGSASGSPSANLLCPALSRLTAPLYRTCTCVAT